MEEFEETMITVQKTVNSATGTVRLSQEKPTINLPSLKNAVKFTNEAKPAAVPDASTSGKRRPNKREKHGEFDAEKLASADRYAELQAIFEDTEDGLSIDEFKVAMRKTVGHKMTDDEIELLFMKVDANCDEHVEWEEYVTYNLLEYQGKTLMFEMMRETPFPNEIKPIQTPHRDIIVSIEFYPTLQKRAGQNYIDHSIGRYLTLSREGVLTIWNMKMKIIKTVNTLSDIVADRGTQPWLVELACMYNVGMVAVTSTDRDVTIFDMQGGNFLRRYYLTGFDDCVTCMSYWVDLNDLNHAILSIGDTSGSLIVFVFDQCLRGGGPFGTFGGRTNTMKKISIAEVIRGFYKGAKGYKFNAVHRDWVLKISYIPELTYLLSCSQTQETSLCIHEFGKKKKQGAVFRVYKGILCFDYCPENMIIATGGMDYWIRVWNPYVYTKPMFILKGHSKPISQVMINAKRNQIVGIDKGRTIRVYDMKDQTCLQTLTGRRITLGKIPLSGAYFNPKLQALLIATNKLAILYKDREEQHVAEIKSHNKPVVSALYNKIFKYVVSACQDSVISVWNLLTGEKIIQAVNAHYRLEKGVEIPVEITAMAFDGPQRRVITGGRDGSVKVWNFNNGSCMQSFCTPDALEITGVAFVNHQIFSTGWSRLVHVYIDGMDEEHRKDWKRKHNEDILCIAHLTPNIIATGSYDGDVVVWSRDTGHVYCTYNASKSVKSIGDTPKTTGRNKEQSRPESLESESSPFTFENVVAEELMKWREKNSSMNKTEEEIMIRLKETLLQKENKWSLKLNSLIGDQVEHPLLPLYRNTPSSALSREEESPLLDLATRRHDYDRLCQLYESAVECITFLETRDRESQETAIMLTSGAEGWVRAWSFHHQGGLLGQFNAAHKIGDVVHTMNTDEGNNFLFTGDSCGYVKTWDISDYCTKKMLSKKQRAHRWKYLNETFAYMRFTYPYKDVPDTLTSSEMRPRNISNRPPPATSLPKATLKWPWLVNSFRAHTKIINKIEYVESEKLLITASNDCSIRLWNINGVHIGTFGETWKLSQKLTAKLPKKDIRIPTDLHRVGSASTLRVLNEGQSGFWKSALTAAKIISQTKSSDEPDEYEQEPEPRTISIKSTPSSAAGDGQDMLKSVQPVKLKTKKPGGSEILGKSYKKIRWHRMPPKMDKFVEINSSISVYRCLPFTDLKVIEDPGQMKVLDDVRNTYYGGCVWSRLTGEEKKQEKQPPFIALYNAIANRPPLPKGKNQAGRTKRMVNRMQKKPEKIITKDDTTEAGQGSKTV